MEPEQSKRLARELGSARLEIMARRGHMLPHVEPQAVMAALQWVEAQSTADTGAMTAERRPAASNAPVQGGSDHPPAPLT